MPIYVFNCNKCNNKFEVLCSMAKETPEAHKCDCGSEAKRIPTNPSIKYVGSGWASVDAKTEKRLSEANNIAENMYERRAEQSAGKSLSNDNDFWQDLASTMGD